MYYTNTHHRKGSMCFASATVHTHHQSIHFESSFLFALVQLVSLNNLLLLVFLDLFIAPPTLVLDNLSSRYVFRRGYLAEKNQCWKWKGDICLVFEMCGGWWGKNCAQQRVSWISSELARQQRMVGHFGYIKGKGLEQGVLACWLEKTV